LHALNVVVDASNFDLLVDHVIGGFGICVMSVSPVILQQAEKGDRTLRGIGFRNMTRLFGEESIVLLQRTGRFEPPHHRAFRELVTAAVNS
jgi:DNA-binding transcriptional LysR family regulator